MMLKRRSFLAAAIAASARGADRDAYGGDTSLRLRRTGFFHLEKTDRWWLVTPDGNAFLSFGLNHVSPFHFTRPECVDHWAKTFGVKDKTDAGQFLPGYREKLRKDLTTLGMNTLGVHSTLRDLPAGFVPYIHTARFADICHYMTPGETDFHDVFSPDFEARCDRIARTEAAPRRDDPFLIGYFFIDCPIFTDRDAAPRHNNIYGAVRPGLPTWPRVLRNLDGQSPGKRAYTDLMRGFYHGNIQEFNLAYGTRFASFDALRQAVNWRPTVDASNEKEKRDNNAFLLRVIDRYYEVAVAAIRKHDPNHLIVGDKLNGNTDTPDEIVALAARHADLVFYQMYGYWEEQKPKLDAWSKLTGKPLFNGDASYAVPYDQMPNPYGPHCRTQEERARRFDDFAKNAFARKDFVGWTWCGWIDGWKTQRQQAEKQHGGLQTPWGEYYQPLTDAMGRFAPRIYDIAKGA